MPGTVRTERKFMPITWDPTRVTQTVDDGKYDETEMKSGLSDPTTAVDPNTDVTFNGKIYKWADLQEAVKKACEDRSFFNKVNPGDNLTPEQVAAQLGKIMTEKFSPELQSLSDAVENAKSGLIMAQEEARGAAEADKVAKDAIVTQKQAALTAAKTALQTKIAEAQAKDVPNSKLESYQSLVREPAPTPESRGGAAPRNLGQQAPQAPAGGGGGGGGGSSPQALGQGSGANGSGTPNPYDPLGLNTPNSSAAYASALYLDSDISQGLGDIFKSRREGQKLMMLFFHLARMAESGDLGAMYQFIKFINYIIAKDKARQNIKISSKLIQLQDLSRKSTELLMQTPTDGDPKQVNAFTKAIHQAKAEETAISTSQKLLADMLQEFAHVVEALTSSTKFLLEAWGRVLRTVTRP